MRESVSNNSAHKMHVMVRVWARHAVAVSVSSKTLQKA